MKVPRMVGTACLVGLSALGAVACGSSGSSTSSSNTSSAPSGGSGAGTISIYSSLPLQGTSRGQSTAVNNGAKLALQQVGGKVGNLSVTFTPLDDSTAASGKWDQGQVSKDAQQALSDSSSIAYIGEFNSGATVISLPILNRVPLLQVSPSNTVVGITVGGAGAKPGEPQIYYPTGKRHYGRIVPKDTIQAAALATLMKGDGCTSVYVLNDKEVYGAGLATNFQSAAAANGLKLDANQGIDPKAPNYRSQASQIHSSCFLYSGITANNAVQVFKDVAAADPTAKLYGPDGVAEAAFTNTKTGIPASLDARVKLTVATLDPKSYPPAGQRFFKQYSKTYNDTNPDPYAIYGYETMSLLLDAIKRSGITASGSDSRQKVIDAFFATKDRRSVLGTYSIDQNGDTSLTDYGAYKVVNGKATFAKVIHAKK